MKLYKETYLVGLVVLLGLFGHLIVASPRGAMSSAATVLSRSESLHSSAAVQVERLGTINFPVSCSPQVQADFNRAVALLHSFQYDLSKKAFADVAQKNPQCAMAYWGEAMSLYTQLWMWPDAKTLQQGHLYIDQAEKLQATERERAYIHAAAIYYQEDPKIDDEARAVTYSDAMAELHEHYSKDDNAAAFYALSLIAVRSPNKAENMARRMKAIAILQELFREEPDNPGVVHYLIHATDTPELAHLGLEAARQYAKAAPDAPHALHMPSHIFTELGMWGDSVESNLASAAAAQKITESQVDNDSGDQLHALSFLEYAYLQTGHDADARRVIDEVKKVPGASPEDIANQQTMFRAMYLEETHQWKDAATFTPDPESYPMMQISAYAAREIGEARMGDTAGARTDIENLRKAQEAMRGAMKGMSMGMMGGGQHSGESLDQMEAEAWLAYADGKQDEALSKMNAAADQGGSSMRMGGVPGIPPSEMLGDLLLELHQPAEAFAAYVKALGESPNRFDSLYGAAHAARLAGNHAAAESYFAKLIQICGANADRPEIRESLAKQQ